MRPDLLVWNVRFPYTFKLVFHKVNIWNGKKNSVVRLSHSIGFKDGLSLPNRPERDEKLEQIPELSFWVCINLVVWPGFYPFKALETVSLLISK